MDFHLGYNGLFPLNRWIPLNVILENQGRSMMGSLEVVVTSGSEYLKNVHSTTYSMRVELPNQSRKLYVFTIRLDSFVYPLILRLKKEGNILLQRGYNLRNYYTPDRLALILGERIFLETSSNFPEGMKPVYSQVEYLPETWYGYDGVETVIIQGPSLKRLRKRQFRALSEWVQSGGQCIISGHIHFSSYLDSRIRELLPVEILGLKERSQLHSLKEFVGEKLDASGPFLILHSTLRQGKVLLQEENLPIIVQREMGKGEVIFLAFDIGVHPFSQWRGRGSFWKKILAARIASDRRGEKFPMPNLLDSMLSRTVVHFPTPFFLMAFVSLYLLSLYLVFRLYRRNRAQTGRRLLYLLGLIVLFSSGGYYFFYYQPLRKDPLLHGYAHLTLSEKKRIAHVHYRVGLYSLRGGYFRITFEPSRQRISPVAAPVEGIERPFSFELRGEDKKQEIWVAMNRWSFRFFELESMIPFPVGGSASVNNLGLTLSLDNLTPHKFRNCQIYYANRLFPVGDIMPDSKVTRFLPRESFSRGAELTLEAVERLAPRLVPSSEAMYVGLMVETLNRVYRRFSSRKDVALLLGWIDTRAVPTRLSGHPEPLKELATLELEMEVDFQET